MNIAPDDLFLMRLNVLSNIGMKLALELLMLAAALLGMGAASWLLTTAALKFALLVSRAWRWCGGLRAYQSIVLFIGGMSVLFYFAGVYAQAWRGQ